MASGIEPEVVGELRTRLLEALALKELPRAGWLRVGIDGPESVAAHAWGVAWLVLALCPDHLDRGRALAMAVLHDLPEVRTGDVTPHDGVDPASKRRAERQALAGLLTGLDRSAELESIWLEYEQETSHEGRFVKACDRLDMALQAERYRTKHGVDTAEFVETALAALEGSSLAALIAGRGAENPAER
ncbi:MAG: HD domain-containing protein [Deltaproteobacteria bacterium]|jgi:putative hydrolase of HD superfamily|nr:HD domain-containing protein [Deltaproteobacteria bacterium]MBW2533662.1 HD domain-containing protein [Deltaproteobacteria bacterium]